MKSTYNNEQFLRERYAELGNGNLIAQELGLNRALVYRWLKQHGITNKQLTRRSVNETWCCSAKKPYLSDAYN